MVKYQINSKSNGKTQNSQNQQQLKGKVVVITGANTGIGFNSAKYLAFQKATVVLACRDKVKAQDAINQIQSQYQQLFQQKKQNSENELQQQYQLDLDFIELDLSDLESVKLFAQKFKQKYSKLNILINNAGVGGLYQKELTKQNYEKTFAVNHLGHFLLTNLLLDVIQNTPDSRIINVSSSRHKLGNIDFDSLENTYQTRKQYHTHNIYGDSKLANIMFTQQLQKILAIQQQSSQNSTKVFAVHPGLVRSDFFRYALQNNRFKCLVYCFWPLIYLISKTCEQGAQSTIHCCVEDFEKLKNGGYYGANCQLSKVQAKFNDEDMLKLWNISEKLVSNY